MLSTLLAADVFPKILPFLAGTALTASTRSLMPRSARQQRPEL
jgi:hypothetical protein